MSKKIVAEFLLKKINGVGEILFLKIFIIGPSNSRFYEGLKGVRVQNYVNTSKLELRCKRSLKTEKKLLNYVQEV